MTPLASTPRYTVERTDCGWDIVDTEKGVSVGTCPTEATAAKSAQQLNALHTGNVKRLAAANFKRDLAGLGRCAGAMALADLLAHTTDEPDEPLDALPITAALLAVKGVGQTRAAHIMRGANVTVLSRRVRDLTERQRGVIATSLRAYADGTETGL